MKTDRGDVVLVFFPHSSLQGYKLRPALVVRADNLHSGLPQTIVAMITSNANRANFPSRVSVLVATPAGQRSGLKTDSVIMCDNLATVLETEIRRIVGTWQDLSSVDSALRVALSL